MTLLPPFFFFLRNITVSFAVSLLSRELKNGSITLMDKNKIFDTLKNAGNKVIEKGKSVKDIKLSRVNIHSFFESLQSNGKTLVITVVVAVVLMVFFCFVVFFVNVKGPEEVLVPEVRGKDLTQALIEMQNKELYPKITLRYSDIPGDEGTILDQSPDAGSIVKGYSRVNLVVSRGVVVDHVENYVGMNFDELKLKLQTLFAGSAKPLIILDSPDFKADISEAGTILAQEPPEGTDISEPVTLKLVVSRGPNFENTRVPYLVGKTVEEMLQIASQSKIVFDFTSRAAAQDEMAGTVVEQQQFDGEFIKNYSRMSVVLALRNTEIDGKKYGIFSAELSDYPYPVPMRIDAADEDGNVTSLVNVLHSGGSFTMPYAVPKNTVLTLYVVDKAVKKLTVH